MQLDEQDLVSPLGGDLELHRAEVEAPPPEPEADPYEALQAQFKEVEAERDAARAEREAERQRAAELSGQLAQHQTNEVHNHKAIFEQALVATSTAVDIAKERYRRARESGDIDEELASTEALQDARDEMRQLRAGYEQVKEAIARPPAQAPVQTADERIEHVITTQFKEPRDQAWIRLHKDDIFGDEKRKKLAILGDEAAVLKGLKSGTDEYYAHMDAHMGYETPDPDVGDAPPVAPVKVVAKAPGKRPPAAPPARSAGGKAGEGSPTSATPEIVALARDLGMSPAKYMEYMDGLKADKYPGYRLFK
jgi:hypothetical protein